MTNRVHLERQGLLDRLRDVSLRGWLELGFQLALTGPLVLAVLAMSGVGHRSIDILAQFTVPAMVATAGATVALFLLRFRGAAGFGLAGCGALIIACYPQLAPPFGRAEAGAPILRLYSANLFYLNNDTTAIRASIDAAAPDIIVLIELGQETTANIDRILKGYPHRIASMRLDQTRGPSRSLIASRYPLVPLTDPQDGLHSVAAIADTPLGCVNIVGVHLTRPWPYQFQWGQISQTMALTDIRRGLTGPVIVAGDFNSVSSARIGRQVQQEMGLLPAPGFPGTWPAALPSPLGITIDQVYRSPDLALVSRKLGRPNGSDHRPVITELTRAVR